MARLEDLVAQVEDQVLRSQLEAAFSELKRRHRFGLVFEEHVPETTTLLNFPVQVGAVVQRRSDPVGSPTFKVLSVNGEGEAVVEPVNGGDELSVPVNDLLVVKRFGEPIYPSLEPVGSVRQGPDDKPSHAAISGENLHALEALVYLFEGNVDCVYLDPPYNTGARDWKYNNRYVDDTDAWRHSKWLSFMEKRLRLSKRLLKPDGVLIVTIDEHEVNHLGMLLERVFPEYLRYMITIVISARGNFKTNFARVEEYAFFCCPPVGHDVITGSKMDLLPEHDEIEVDPDAQDIELPSPLDVDAPDAELDRPVVELRHARRRGPDSRRQDRPSMFYPILIDEKSEQVMGVGEAIDFQENPDLQTRNGLRPIWPIDSSGEHRRWRWGRERMQAAVDEGLVRLGRYNKKQDSWTINLAIERRDNYKKLKTVWRHTSHDAGTHGTSLVDNILGERGRFTFPKSVYAVRDCLQAVLRERPDALVVDAFAGSGTTLHATVLLNEEHGGQRRCILITNNEVEEATAERLHQEGLFRGDPEFEAHGIFEKATKPRCEGVITGRRPDGTPIPGAHIHGRPFADGFEENVEFFRLSYLDPDDVDLGTQFAAIHPLLWLAAGGIGEREEVAADSDYVIPNGGRYAILFRESRFRQFRQALGERPEVTHVWIVTDSEEAFAEMRSALPSSISTSMLYQDYLRSFRINTEKTF
jgi:adenine-specific DNA-methyltransferase